MFVGVTAEKLVGNLFAGGAEFIQNFHKGEIYLIGENFVGKKFSLGKPFCHPASILSLFPRYNEYIWLTLRVQ